MKRLNRLSRPQLEQVGERIRRHCCSEPWERVAAGAVFSGEVSVREVVEDPDRRGRSRRIVFSPVPELESHGIYPPSDVDRPSQMKQCSRCHAGLTWYPRHYVHTGTGEAVCEDCFQGLKAWKEHKDAAAEEGRFHESTTESPTRKALDVLEHRSLTLVEPKLEPEDDASLRAEIDRYMAAVGAKPATMKISF